jgi:predicted permease
MLRVWVAKFRGLFGQGRADKNFEDEMQAHLELLAERFVAQGMTREDAAQAARRQFGNTTLLQQRQREGRGFAFPSELSRDVRFGMRMLRKNFGSNAAVVVALALGIGMNTAVFSFVNALLLRSPTGVEAPQELRAIWMHNRASAGIESYLPFTYPDYTYFRDHSQSFAGAGVIAYDGDGEPAIWNRAGEGQVVQGQLVSGNFFSVLSVNAVMGRSLTKEDDELSHPRPVVVLSHSFWQQRLSGDPEIVGRTMMLNGTSFNVVGVAPAGFAGMLVAQEPDFWVPLTMQEQFTRDKNRFTNRQSNWLLLAGRLGPGVDPIKAQAEMHLLARQVELAHPESNKNLDAMLFAATLTPGPYRICVSAFTGLLMAVFGLVLLIACTNAASLLLARATGRAREMAIRSALGSGRTRLIRQMMVESLLLSSLAGAAGIVLAWWVNRLLLSLKPESLPITLDVPLDWRVLLFTMVVSVATGVVFGLVPAWRIARVDAAPVLKEETQSAGFPKSRLRGALLIGEIATCVVLLTGATLCVRSLMHANTIDPGFDTVHTAVATLDAGSLGYSDAKAEAFYRQLLEHVRALPNVAAASYADHLPLGTARDQTSAGLQVGVEQGRVSVDFFPVEPDYFKTMGIPLRGRDFTQDEMGEPVKVAIVNEALAQKLWPGRDAVGQRIALAGEKTSTEVIGVVKTGKYRTIGEEPLPAIYRGHPHLHRILVVRTANDPRLVRDALRREVQLVDPLMAATDVQTVAEYMALPLFPARATGLLLGAAGVLAAVLTTIGLFGVIAYVVSQRTHEIGVRMALGARRTDVLRLVMRRGLFVTMFGLGIGMVVALASVRLLSPLLYGIGASDPTTLIGVSVGLTAVALLACYIPARRAMRVDPMSALRYE